MKLGMLLNTQFPKGVDARTVVPQMVEQVRVARQCGFGSLWFPQHYLTEPMQMFQMSAMLPYLLREAEGMTIGGDILILPMFNPVFVAEDAAALDVLSGGKFVLGVGLGYRDVEFEAFNVPLSERVPRLVEGIHLIRRLWREDRITHAGKHFKVTDAGIGLKPLQPGGPQVWIAGHVDPAVRRAARLGDAWLIVPSVSFEQIVPAMKAYREALAEHGKQPADFPVTREVYVGSSQATAMQECVEYIKSKYATYATWGQRVQQGQRAADAFDAFAAGRFIIGDASFVREEIIRYREAFGVNHFIGRMHWPGMPQELVLGSIRRLGELFAKGF